jgi:hypothetical protein
MELWNFISLVWGYVSPILIEFLGKKVHGWGKVTLAIIFCLISGVIVAILENGINYDWSDVGNVFKFAGFIFAASQVAWVATWKKVIDKK